MDFGKPSGITFRQEVLQHKKSTPKDAYLPRTALSSGHEIRVICIFLNVFNVFLKNYLHAAFASSSNRFPSSPFADISLTHSSLTPAVAFSHRRNSGVGNV